MKSACFLTLSILLLVLTALFTAPAAPDNATSQISQPPDNIFAPVTPSAHANPLAANYCDAIHSEYPGMVKVNGIYYAYYSGFGCTWQIYLATSSDGIHFNKQGAININDGWADQRAFPFVFYEDGLFKLYYGGNVPYQIGYATSSDGINFNAETHPVLSPESGNYWDNVELVRPSIVEVVSPKAQALQSLKLASDTSRLYMMYYNGFGTNDSAVGLAYSSDGISWTRYVGNPVVTNTNGIYTSFAITESGTTYLYYHTNNGIYLSTSADGVNFTPYSSNPILAPSTTNGWDAGLVYGPLVRRADDGSYIMYYNGIPGQNADYGMIGIATSLDLIHFTPRADNPAITVGNTPANFAAYGNPDGSISLSWHDVVTDAQSYRLEYGVASQSYTATLDVSGVESYTFTPPTPGDYFMTVIGTTNGQDGYPAAEREVNTNPLATPTLNPSPIPSSTLSPIPSSTLSPIPSSTLSPIPSSTPPTNTPSPTPTDCANPFVDISGNTFYTAIHALNCRGVISGSDATHYAPYATATRGQFAKIVVSGFSLPLSTPQAGQSFSDVPPGYFAYLYIESGYAQGILSGFDAAGCAAHDAAYPCYLPNQAITRGQITKLVVNAAHYPPYTPSNGQDFNDVPPSNVFYTSIETAYHMGIIAGYSDHSFRPNNSIRRDEMAQIVYQAVNNPLGRNNSPSSLLHC